jgi:hypothetical protein
MDPAQPVPDRIDPETFFTRPDIFPLEFGQGHIQFVPMTRESYGRSLFTDRGRIVPAATHGWQVPTGQVLAEFERRGIPQPRLFFIFHIAHCGSTLLARAIDVPGRTLVIREPFALRQLAVDAVAANVASDPVTRERCLHLATALLGRRYAEDQPVIVKANVPVNFILEPLMALHPESRGILLYADLDDYLLSVLKTPIHRRWVMNVSSQLADAIRATPGLEDTNLTALDAPQTAACLWIAQLNRFHRAIAECDRLKSLNCRDLFGRPAETLREAMKLAGAPVTPSEAQAIAEGDLFRRHAKDPRRKFDRSARARQMARLAEEMAPELEAARSWAASMPAWKRVTAPMKRPLL